MIDKIKQLNRGVSNAVGVLILVSITVLLAVIVSNLVLGFTFFEEPVNANANIEINGSTAEVQWTTNQNAELIEIQVNNNRVETLDSVGSSSEPIENLSTGDKITAIGIRDDYSQVLNRATVTNGLNNNQTYTTQNTNLVKSIPNSKSTASDGWDIFSASNGSTNDYVTDSKLTITDNTNVSTTIDKTRSLRSFDESRITINVDSIDSGTPNYKVGYKYQSDTNTFDGNVLDQGELTEGTNNISVSPKYTGGDLSLVIEGESGIDVTYNSVTVESLADARNIEAQYPDGNKWVDLYSSTETVYDNGGISAPTFTVNDSTLEFTDVSFGMYGEFINVSDTDYIEVVIDVEETGDSPSYNNTSLTQGKNTVSFDTSNQNIHVPILSGVEKINSFTVTPAELEQDAQTTFTIKNSVTDELVSDATVTINGTTKTTNSDGETTFTIDQGSRTIDITHPDYKDYSEEKLITDTEVTIELEDNTERVSSSFGFTTALYGSYTTESSESIKLQSDIDFSEESFEEGADLENLDGNGYSLQNITLAGSVSFINELTGEMKDVTYTNITIKSGGTSDEAPSSIVTNNSGDISNVTIDKGTFQNYYNSNTNDIEFSAIATTNNGSITESTIKNSTYNIKDSIDYGGVTAINKGIIKNTTIKDTTFDYKLSSDSSTDFGSITGTNKGTINNISVDNVSLTNSTDTEIEFSEIGGAVGINESGSTIKNSNSNVDIQLPNAETVGGLVGENNGSIEQSSSTGSIVVGLSGGGLIENNNGTVSDSTSEVNVTGVNGGSVGSFIAYNEGNITGSSASGTVKSTGRQTGGFIGKHQSGNVSNSYSTGNVTITEYKGAGDLREVGGFIGEANGSSGVDGGTISNSYSTGSVDTTATTTEDDYSIGGFIGLSNAEISESYSTGNVNTGSNGSPGGFVGWNENTITDSYATGDVSGSGRVGGLVNRNRNSGTITNSFATGTVSGGTDSAGLVGSNSGSVEDSYWDTESTGKSNSIGYNSSVDDGSFNNLTGLTTSEMTGSSASSNMSALDFSSIWSTSSDYPDLQWQE